MSKNIRIKNILWSLVFLLFAAGIGSAQSLLYFPQVAVGSLGNNVVWLTAMALTNPAGPGTPAANGTITLRRDDGTPMNVTFIDETGASVGSAFQIGGGQTRFFFSANAMEVPLSTGFATVASSLPVTGALIFAMASPSGAGAQAGVPPATPLTRQGIVAIKNSSFNTGVAVANPGTETSTITFQLVDKSGSPIAPEVTRKLAANNHSAFFVGDLFPAAPSAIWGTLRITSDRPVVSTALAFNPDNTFETLPVFPLP